MRHDDTNEKSYFRSSERLFRVNSDWYFAAREGDQGPFESQHRAEKELGRYIEEQVSLHSFMQSGVKMIKMEGQREDIPLLKDAVDQNDEMYQQVGMVL
ncbi:MAG: DUF6316 family protein [Pseudomonadota bacterium]